MRETHRMIGDEPMLNAYGMSLLFGIDESEVLAEGERQGGNSFRVPDEWIKSGIRRRKEYNAHTGRNDAEGLLLWAAQRGGDAS